jgi:hypothetical protein
MQGTGEKDVYAAPGVSKTVTARLRQRSQALHPRPSDGVVGPLSGIFFSMRASAHVATLWPLPGRRPPRTGDSPWGCQRRCPHCPGLRTLLSARPTFHSEDIKRGRRSANLSFLEPQRSAAAHPRDRDAWRILLLPRRAAAPKTFRIWGFQEGGEKNGNGKRPDWPESRRNVLGLIFLFI